MHTNSSDEGDRGFGTLQDRLRRDQPGAIRLLSGHRPPGRRAAGTFAARTVDTSMPGHEADRKQGQTTRTARPGSSQSQSYSGLRTFLRERAVSRSELPKRFVGALAVCCRCPGGATSDRSLAPHAWRGRPRPLHRRRGWGRCWVFRAGRPGATPGRTVRESALTVHPPSPRGRPLPAPGPSGPCRPRRCRRRRWRRWRSARSSHRRRW